jgi:hypothetical protein
VYPFVGFDGRYYLCSSDWRKQVAVGDVFADRAIDVLPAKLVHTATRRPICHECSHDPTNVLARALDAFDRVDRAGGDVEAAAAHVEAVLLHYASETDAATALGAHAASVPVEFAPRRQPLTSRELNHAQHTTRVPDQRRR